MKFQIQKEENLKYLSTFVAHATAALSGNRISSFSASNCAHTSGNRNPTWWLVDLGIDVKITNVIITNRNSNNGRKDSYIFLKLHTEVCLLRYLTWYKQYRYSPITNYHLLNVK